jgi:hypothetical protein
MALQVGGSFVLDVASGDGKELAERVGFEPTLEFPLNTLSKRAPSATRPSLRRYQEAAAGCAGARQTCLSILWGFTVDRNLAQGNSQSEIPSRPHTTPCAEVVLR